MTLDLTSIDGSFAREVRGLDLWCDHDESTIDALRRAWSEAGVLVFRRQALDEAEMVRFFSRFGEPDIIVRTDWQSRNAPEVIHISNMKDQAGRSIGGLGAGELDWHTDQSYVANPATGAMLYMVESPAEGVPTYWANLRLAYAALPDETKGRIDGLHAVYDYIKRQSTYDDEEPMSAELRARTPPLTHPLVAADPVSGAKSLYLDPTTTTGIAGLPAMVGDPLLAALNEHATRPEFVYRHDWRTGDVVMWDNGFLLHRRDAFAADASRWLKRLTIKLPTDRHVVPASALIAV